MKTPFRCSSFKPPRNYTFRGESMPRVQEVLLERYWVTRHRATLKNRTLSKGFAHMLRHWNTGQETDGRMWWIICRDSFPMREFMHLKKRPNHAVDRLQPCWPF